MCLILLEQSAYIRCRSTIEFANLNHFVITVAEEWTICLKRRIKSRKHWSIFNEPFSYAFWKRQIFAHSYFSFLLSKFLVLCVYLYDVGVLSRLLSREMSTNLTTISSPSHYSPSDGNALPNAYWSVVRSLMNSQPTCIGASTHIRLPNDC